MEREPYLPSETETPPDDTTYHLQIQNCVKNGDARNDRRAYARHIDCVLEELFEEEGKTSRETCLLRYKTHTIATVTGASGAPISVIKLAFKLNEGISVSSLTEAFKKFCRKVFTGNCESLSKSGLLGLRPIRGTILAGLWNSGFLFHTLETGGKCLKKLKDAYERYLRPGLEAIRPHIPSWLLACCLLFTCVSQTDYNFGVWAAAKQAIEVGRTVLQMTLPAGPAILVGAGLVACGVVVFEVSEWFMNKRAEETRKNQNEVERLNNKYADLQLKKSLEDFSDELGKVMTEIKKLNTHQNPSTEQYIRTGNSLFIIVEKAADLQGTNEAAMDIYRKICQLYANDEAKSKAFATMYTGFLGILDAGFLGTASPSVDASVLVSKTIQAIANNTIWEQNLDPRLKSFRDEQLREIAIAACAVSGPGGVVTAGLAFNGFPIVASIGFGAGLLAVTIGLAVAFTVRKKAADEAQAEKERFVAKLKVLQEIYKLFAEIGQISFDISVALTYLYRIEDDQITLESDSEVQKVWESWWERVKKTSRSTAETLEDFTREDLDQYLKEVERSLSASKSSIDDYITELD